MEHVVQKLPQEKEVKVPIMARDVDPEAVELTTAPGKADGSVAPDYRWNKRILPIPKPMEGTTIVMNPPYGERMKPEDIESLYGMIGTTLKHKFPGSDAWILSSSKKALGRVGLKPASRKQILLQWFPGMFICEL